MNTQPKQTKQLTLIVLPTDDDQSDGLIGALVSLEELFPASIAIQDALLVTCKTPGAHSIIANLMSELRNPGTESLELDQEIDEEPPSTPQAEGQEEHPVPALDFKSLRRQMEADPEPENAAQPENSQVDPLADRICEMCGKPFSPKNSRSSVCSRKCLNARYRLTHASPPKRNHIPKDTHTANVGDDLHQQVFKYRLPNGKEVNDVSNLLRLGKLSAGDVVIHREKGPYTVTQVNNSLILRPGRL